MTKPKWSIHTGGYWGAVAGARALRKGRHTLTSETMCDAVGKSADRVTEDLSLLYIRII